MKIILFYLAVLWITIGACKKSNTNTNSIQSGIITATICDTTTCDTSDTIDIENVPLQGGFLVKTLVVSIDPYLRNLMVAPGTKSPLVCVLNIQSCIF